MSRKSGSRFFETGHAGEMPVNTKIHLDPNGHDLTIERSQDVEDILARNKAFRAHEQTSEWGRHIASIPCVILEKWLNEEAARGNATIRWGSREFDALVARKLRDPDWAYLRTDKPALMMGWAKQQGN
jgi:hypothetical protein